MKLCEDVGHQADIRPSVIDGVQDEISRPCQ